ncbi:hypothetical protein B0H13DRAFT_1865095 [Mycena leptocephala]|nr:hypothetical protein B0H13DRAFT_1865095 [Mycena leptocephala]
MSFLTELRTLPPSHHEYLICGLHLTCLLTQNRIADFHTSLESLSATAVKSPYIMHPVNLECWLVEGSYAKAPSLRPSSLDPPVQPKGNSSRALIYCPFHPPRRLLPRLLSSCKASHLAQPRRLAPASDALTPVLRVLQFRRKSRATQNYLVLYSSDAAVNILQDNFPVNGRPRAGGARTPSSRVRVQLDNLKMQYTATQCKLALKLGISGTPPSRELGHMASVSGAPLPPHPTCFSPSTPSFVRAVLSPTYALNTALPAPHTPSCVLPLPHHAVPNAAAGHNRPNRNPRPLSSSWRRLPQCPSYPQCRRSRQRRHWILRGMGAVWDSNHGLESITPAHRTKNGATKYPHGRDGSPSDSKPPVSCPAGIAVLPAVCVTRMRGGMQQSLEHIHSLKVRRRLAITLKEARRRHRRGWERAQPRAHQGAGRPLFSGTNSLPARGGERPA